MSNESDFSPSWISSPGDTIKDILSESSITLEGFSFEMDIPKHTAEQLLHGKIAISEKIAEKLSATLGASKSFWLNRDVQYSAAKNAVNQDFNDDIEWLEKLPISDMIKNKWISPASNKKTDKLLACFDYFGVRSSGEWYESFENLLHGAAFRTSSSFDSSPESVVTWLQQGISSSQVTELRGWDRAKFEVALIEARTLSRTENPGDFVPKLQKLFADCGVAISIVRTPAKCHASGATLNLSPNHRLMILSFRFLTDDHFWFTLFHEAGHLLLHDSESLFLEGVDNSNKQETEANEFSAKILIPEEFQAELRTLSSKEWKKIVKFARKIGVSKGIVVGQLQHLGLVNHNYLNKLKTRYKWNSNL